MLGLRDTASDLGFSRLVSLRFSWLFRGLKSWKVLMPESLKAEKLAAC